MSSRTVEIFEEPEDFSVQDAVAVADELDIAPNDTGIPFESDLTDPVMMPDSADALAVSSQLPVVQKIILAVCVVAVIGVLCYFGYNWFVN